MTSIDDIPTKHNKDYDHADDDGCCSPGYVVDNIFNDLMDADKKHNKYIYQALSKFKDLRRNSQVTFFDIYKKDIRDETRKRLERYVRNCKTSEEATNRLNGIITEVIALIFKQAEPLILSTIKFEDPVLVKRSINEIRTTISEKWGFIE